MPRQTKPAARGVDVGATGARSPSGSMLLTVGYPPSTNHLYRSVRARSGKTIRVKTPRAKAYQASVAKAAWAWGFEFGSFPASPYLLVIVLYPPSGRRIDVSNGIKALEDGLFAGMERDDREVVEVRVRAAMADPANPRAEVMLSTVVEV